MFRNVVIIVTDRRQGLEKESIETTTTLALNYYYFFRITAVVCLITVSLKNGDLYSYFLQMQKLPIHRLRNTAHFSITVHQTNTGDIY